MKDLCPVGTMYRDINEKMHMECIDKAALGPADPRAPSTVFWQDKQTKWQVPEGTARTRLCMNCSHYDNSSEAMACLEAGEGKNLKASELPVEPRWADIEGMPAAVCTRWLITCSALRTCDDWEDPLVDPDNANVLFVSVDAEDESEDESEDEEDMEKAESSDRYKPTAGMATEAERGLAWKQEGKAGGTLVGMARANQLKNKEALSARTVLRMYSFFSRHEPDKAATGFSPGEAGYPSAGRVAWALWGGDAGYTWSKAKRDQIMRKRKK